MISFSTVSFVDLKKKNVRDERIWFVKTIRAWIISIIHHFQFDCEYLLSIDGKT